MSDALNHTSIVNGARASGATIRVFHHGDVEMLEAMLRDAIVTGQPRTHRPWRKIFVVVEGIYSMEGDICNLRGIVDVAKKYKAFVYLDEAHSIGALGATGRGACEYCGVEPSEVDIMMGTFTKSFGAMGGYIAASEEFIRYLRSNTAGTLYGTSMSPVVAQQVLTALRIIAGKQGGDTGKQKLTAVRDNANYFRQGLLEMGCEVFGDWDSPVIPIMLYNPPKIAEFSRECKKRGVREGCVGWGSLRASTASRSFAIDSVLRAVGGSGGGFSCHALGALAGSLLHFCGTHQGGSRFRAGQGCGSLRCPPAAVSAIGVRVIGEEGVL